MSSKVYSTSVATAHLSALYAHTAVDAAVADARVADEDNGAPAHWTPSWGLLKHSLAVVLPCVLPILLLSWALYHEHATLEIEFLSIFVLLIVLLIIIGVALLEVSTEDTISAMVAQRFNKLSYCAILVLCGASFYTSAFITAGAIARSRDGKDNTEWVVILASLSPLISVTILVVPLMLSKNAAQLGFVPAGPLYGLAENEYHFPIPWWTCNCCLRSPQRAVNLHRLAHYTCIGTGLTAGYISLIYHINTSVYSTSWAFELVFLIVSGVCVIFFIVVELVGFKSNSSSLAARRFVLLVEYIGLYYYLIDMIFVGIVAGDLISKLG